ncbi:MULTISPECIES: serine/threonine-protein kinase [unclassified Streptomyces]|uniref:serine/threonine-protein kinase n=1 Tax=unclassified Streptomyces TaxID=2593676 RepID=UPI0038663D51
MGMVYMARSRGGSLVAVKVARPGLAADPTFRARFRAEVAAARGVAGLHTVPVVDADPDAPAPWLATVYVAGPTLSQLLAERGPMDERRLRGLGAALAEALQAIHGHGLVHRDLKPGNIVMAEDGPMVMDFGIARAVENTRPDATVKAFGTPGYLAPEQAEGGEVGPPADVFALGAVLVAAAGGSAFGAGTPVAPMYRSVHHEADLTAVPAGLRPMVAACVEKAPDRRPSTEQLLDWFSPQGAAGPPGGHAPTAYAPPSTEQQADTEAPQAPAPVRPAPPAAPIPVPPPATAAPTPPAPAPPATQAPTPAMPPYAPTVAAPHTEFLAMDRKNAVVADADGISLGNNGRVAAFPWAGIDTTWCTRGPKGLVVAVALPDGSIHSCEVGTRNPVELEGWKAQFNAVRTHFLPGG